MIAAYLVAGDSGFRRRDHQLDCKSFDEDVVTTCRSEVRKLENQHFDEDY